MCCTTFKDQLHPTLQQVVGLDFLTRSEGAFVRRSCLHLGGFWRLSWPTNYTVGQSVVQACTWFSLSFCHCCFVIFQSQVVLHPFFWPEQMPDTPVLISVTKCPLTYPHDTNVLTRLETPVFISLTKCLLTPLWWQMSTSKHQCLN